MKFKLKPLLLAAAMLLPLSQAQAAMVTWDIATTFQDLKGTVTFDNAPIAGLIDGAFDGNDTHIYGSTLRLSSVVLGINYVDTNAYFQPLTNTYDNKHIDSCYSCSVSSNLGQLSFAFTPDSDQGNPAVGAASYRLTVNGAGTLNGVYRWAFNDAGGQTNSNLVPEPSALALVGLGLLGLVATRRKSVQS